MLLNIAYLLTGLAVATSVTETPEDTYLASTLVPVTEGQNLKENETDNRVNGAESHTEYKRPPISEDYLINWSNEKYDYVDYSDKEENWFEMNYDYPYHNRKEPNWFEMNYDYPYHNRKESNWPKTNYEYPYSKDNKNYKTDNFEEEWGRAGAMEVSLIGRLDPNSAKYAAFSGEDLRKREISNKYQVSIRRERHVRRPFDKTKGCNKLPVAPNNSLGTCHHTDSVAKCWVFCHKFNSYPDDTKQKTFLCLDGYWTPKNLPDCAREVPCVNSYISGKNMSVSCVRDSEMTKCTATCESGSTFPDKEVVKVIECESRISHSKFPDCHFD